MSVRIGEQDVLAQGIANMTHPNQILYISKQGKPEFKLFTVVPNLRSIDFDSGNKKKRGLVKFEDVMEIRFGQHTDKFAKANRRDLTNRSFSILYKDAETRLEETLDLVCKNEDQFQLWTTNVQYLTDCHKRGNSLDPALVALVAKKQPKIEGKKNQEIDSERASEKNEVSGFGWNKWGQLGNGNKENARQPHLIDNLLGRGITRIDCGWSHSVAIGDHGEVLQFGNTCATGETDTAPSVVTALHFPSGVNRIRKVACGGYHTVAYSFSGELYSWGVNVFGQLGTGDNIDRKEPVLLSSLSTFLITDIACGVNFTLALGGKDVGEGLDQLWSWGQGDRGQLGHGNTDDLNEPTIVNELQGVEVCKISAGDAFAIACTKNQTFSWGHNGSGQLGLGHTEDQSKPVMIDSLKEQSIMSISCGAAHVTALARLPILATNVVYSWGLNTSSQLGLDTSDRCVLVPTTITSLNKVSVVDVCNGYMHSLVRDMDGDVLGCGSNCRSQLGVSNNFQDIKTFTYIDGLRGKNARSLCAGGMHSLILTARVWVDDNDVKECTRCMEVFTFTNRRHHCRHCGGIFCGKCSSKKVALLEYGLIDPTRVCDICYDRVAG